MLSGKSLVSGALVLALANCSSPEGQRLLESVGLDNIEAQGCALGGLGGAIAGGVIGNQSGDAALGAVIGGALGALIGCSTGRIIEERRADAASDAEFFDQQIALSNQRASELQRDNADIRRRISANDTAIANLSAQRGSLAQRQTQARTAFDVNTKAIEEYETLIDQAEQEIEVQKTVLSEIRALPNEGRRARELEAQIARLEEQNRALEQSVDRLSAQNDRIGGFL
jgi:hypothetical protein